MVNRINWSKRKGFFWSKDGPYVKYEDYRHLEAEYDGLREAVQNTMRAYDEIGTMGVLPFRTALVHMEQVALTGVEGD